MSNPRSRVPADQAINGEFFVVPKGFIMDLSQDVSNQVDVSVAACFCYRVGNRTCLCPFLKSGGVGWEGVGRGNNVQWHFFTMVMLRCCVYVHFAHCRQCFVMVRARQLEIVPVS